MWLNVSRLSWKERSCEADLEGGCLESVAVREVCGCCLGEVKSVDVVTKRVVIED